MRYHRFTIIAFSIIIGLICGCKKTPLPNTDPDKIDKPDPPVTLPKGVSTLLTTTNTGWIMALHTGATLPAPYYVEGYNNIATDALGNFFILFNPGGPADLDPSPGVTLKAKGPVCLAKYDGDGKFLWHKLFEASTITYGKGLVVDPFGNAILAFSVMDDGTLTTDDKQYAVKGKGETGCFVKVNSAGKTLGIYEIGYNEIGISSSGKLSIYNIATDAAGNIYATGLHDGFTGTTIPANSSSYNTIFTIKLNNNGAFQWCFVLGCDNWIVPPALAVDKAQNVFFTGFLGSPIRGLKIPGADLSEDGRLICKLNKDGNLVWLKNYFKSENQFEEITAMVTDDNGSVYTVGNEFLSDDNDIVRKFTSNGEKVWKTITPTFTDRSNPRMAVNSKGDILVADNFIKKGSSIFGYGVNLTRYSSAGNTLWYKKLTGVNTDLGQAYLSGIAYDKQDNIHIIGIFEHDFNFFNATVKAIGALSDSHFIGKTPDY
jgi:hypothetical protein